MQHKEAAGGSVTALTLGPSDADKVLKDAKAIGVDEIVRVWDDSWNEMDSNGIQRPQQRRLLGLEQIWFTVERPQWTPEQVRPALVLLSA